MPVRTYQDAVQYLTDQFDVDGKSSRISRNVRRAVEEAYRELPQQAYWSYYRRRAIINTVASQSTGTIAYTHSTRTVTLTGSTFPSDAEKYRIIIDNAHYDIESYTDSTNVVLPSLSNPGANVSSGETYALYRNEYPLPSTFRRALGLIDVSSQVPLRIISDKEEQSLQQSYQGTPGVPDFAAIRNTGEQAGGLSLIFNCPPSAARSYDLLYDAFPRQFVIAEKYSTGTVSVSSGSASLTGSGTTFPSNCAGCVIRLSADSGSEPTGPYGALIEGQDIDNPYSFQTSVKSYSSATALTLTDAATAAYSGVKYTLSDPLDLEEGAMLSAFWRLAEANYARLARFELPVIQMYEMQARNAVILAKENDVRSVGRQNSMFVSYRPVSNTGEG